MSSSKLDISDPAIGEAIAEIMDGKPNNWVLFGYVPKTDRLRVVESGTGGLKELREELSDGSVSFGFVRFEVSEAFKYVFITWCGEGVMGMGKANYAAHSKDMEIFMKMRGRGYHVQINARNEKDLGEKLVVDKINSAKGANFLQAKSSKEEKGPVLKDQSSQFWNKQKNIDQKHSEEMVSHEKKKDDALVRARDIQTQNLSEAAHLKLQEMLSSKENEVARRKSIMIKRTVEETERYEKTKADIFRQQQIKQDSAPKAAFGAAKKDAAPAPSHIKYNPPPVASSKADAVSYQNSNNSANAPSSGGAGGMKNRFEQQAQAQAPAQVQAPPPKKVAPVPPPASKKPPPPPPPSYPTSSSKPAPPPPVVEESYYQPPPPPPEEEPYYQDDYNQGSQQYEEPAQQYNEPAYEEPQQQYEEPAYEEPQQQYEEPQQQYEEPQQAASGGSYPKARALYDYQGEVEGDLSFGEGDTINILDDTDPSGWWEGELNGVTGFFPSNFVVLE